MIQASFQGTEERMIDEKGRVAIPTEFREALRAFGGERLVLTNFIFEKVPCIDAYPASEWERLLAKARDLPRFDRSMISFFQNYYLAGAQAAQCDRQGRILIRPRLREYARLKTHVVIAGAGPMFRIFDRDAWEPLFRAGERVAMDSPEVLDRLGL